MKTHLFYSVSFASKMIRYLVLGLQMRVKKIIDLRLTLEQSTQYHFFLSTLFKAKLDPPNMYSILNHLSNISSKGWQNRNKFEAFSKHWSVHQGILMLERKMNLEGAFE